MGIFDDDLAHQLADSNVRLSRSAGALTGLPAALEFKANLLVISGQLTRAAELASEASGITTATGGVHGEAGSHAEALAQLQARYEKALEQEGELTAEERRARNALVSRQVTLR